MPVTKLMKKKLRQKQTVRFIVEVTYRDDKRKTYRCCDIPYIGSGWLTLYPEGNKARRVMIPSEGIAEIDWWIEAK